jgi:signal peptidase I
MKKRSSMLAAACSLIEPGLGFLYLGSFYLGLLVAGASLILQFAILLSGVFRSFAATIAAYLLVLIIPRFAVAAYSAFRARSIGSIQLSQFNHWYVYAVIALLPHVPGRLIPLIRDVMPLNVMALPTVSMQPSIEPDELVMVDRQYYNTHSLRQGDVVIFRSPYDSRYFFLKRCVGLAGQKIEIRDGVLFVDARQFAPLLPLFRSTSKVLPRDFEDDRIRPVGAGNEDQYGPVIVPDSCCFLLGDHRDNSLDSRYFGFVNQRNIKGKALYIFYSDDFDRIGRTIF